MNRRNLVLLLSLVGWLLFFARGLAQQEQSRFFLPLLVKARSPIEIHIYSLKPGNPQATTLDIWVLARQNNGSDSLFLYSVTARLADRVTELTYEYVCMGSICEYGYHGQISLEGLARESYLLKIEALDSEGGVAEAEQLYLNDQVPRVVLHSPARYDTTIDPSIHLHATCTDDDPAGCSAIQLFKRDLPNEEPVLFASAQGGVLSETLTLPPGSGQYLLLDVVGIDSAGQRSNLYSGALYPESSIFVAPPALTKIEEVQGLILDVDATRILYMGNIAFSASPLTGTLMLHDRVSRQTTPIQTGVRLDVLDARLFSQGVIFALTPDLYIWDRFVYEWRNGQVSQIGTVEQRSFLVRGNYAGWWEWNSNNYVLRDLTTGNNQVAFSSSFDGYHAKPTDFDLATNGDVVYRATDDALHRLFRYRAGETTQLTPSEATWTVHTPRTDGESVIYHRSYLPPEEGGTSVMLLGPGSEVELISTEEIGGGDVSYQISNGWIAYTLGSAGGDQLWIRSPEGTKEQASLGSEPASVEIRSLTADGKVLYEKNGTEFWLLLPGQASNPRHLYTSHAPAQREFWLDGRLFIAIDSALFEVQGVAGME